MPVDYKPAEPDKSRTNILPHIDKTVINKNHLYDRWDNLDWSENFTISQIFQLSTQAMQNNILL